MPSPVSPTMGLLAALAVSLHAAPVDFWSQSGSHSSVNGALQGQTVYDHLGGSNYSSYIGELILMPVDQHLLAPLSIHTPGLAVGDANDLYAGKRGLVGFCIDSETSFLTSADLSQIRSYTPTSFAAANSRYVSEGVDYYLNNGLRRAAYLLETYLPQIQGDGDLYGAALQAAIWETLYDSNPNVSTGSGNYYVRNNTQNSSVNATANQVISIANGWLTQAKNAQWGGSGYDPGDRVIFWLDPNSSQVNQSIITLNLTGHSIQAIPEPSAMLLALGSACLLLGRRRR